MFLRKAGLEGCMPRVYACGSRLDAYKNFIIALRQGQNAFLLVDSEGPIPEQCSSPWEYLSNRVGDAWECPLGANDEHCHLMVQMMESWFFADKETLENVLNKLPAKLGTKIGQIESLSKDEISRCLGSLGYDKGRHSFKILERTDPQKVMQASPWAKRFVDTLLKTANLKAAKGARHS